MVLSTLTYSFLLTTINTLCSNCDYFSGSHNYYIGELRISPSSCSWLKACALFSMVIAFPKKFKCSLGASFMNVSCIAFQLARYEIKLLIAIEFLFPTPLSSVYHWTMLCYYWLKSSYPAVSVALKTHLWCLLEAPKPTDQVKISVSFVQGQATDYQTSKLLWGLVEIS